MATDPGITSGTYRLVDPHYTFFEDAGIITTHYSAAPAAEVVVMPTQTGPMTGVYDPEWSAMMAIE